LCFADLPFSNLQLEAEVVPEDNPIIQD